MDSLACPRHPGQPGGFCPRCAVEQVANDAAPPDLATAAHELAAALAGHDVDGALDLTAPPVGRVHRIAEALTRFAQAIPPPCCCRREENNWLLRRKLSDAEGEIEELRLQNEAMRRRLAERGG